MLFEEDFQSVIVLVDKAVSVPLGAAVETLKFAYLLALIDGGALGA